MCREPHYLSRDILKPTLLSDVLQELFEFEFQLKKKRKRPQFRRKVFERHEPDASVFDEVLNSALLYETELHL